MFLAAAAAARVCVYLHELYGRTTGAVRHSDAYI